MKTFILSIDYELFLGSSTGSVNECMIGPTGKLLTLLEYNNSKMTVFWDILHYYRLLQLEERFVELKEDRIVIEEQILNFVKKGHDVQMHLHPHWLDAQYENGKWNFKYDRFKLHNLSRENNMEDINTIIGCISITKKIIEDTIRKIKPLYTVTSFRAGGYLIEPFSELKEALAFNKIYVDSSVAPEMFNNNGVFSYNFSKYPRQPYYRFEDSLSKVYGKGNFIEIPIKTIKIPILINILFTLLRRVKYPNLESKRVGSGSGDANKIDQKNNSKKFINLLTKKRVNQFTTDNNFREKFNYLYKKAPNYSTMILHPKLLNEHTLGLLVEYLSNYKIKFISLPEYLKIYG